MDVKKVLNKEGKMVLCCWVYLSSAGWTPVAPVMLLLYTQVPLSTHFKQKIIPRLHAFWKLFMEHLYIWNACVPSVDLTIPPIPLQFSSREVRRHITKFCLIHPFPLISLIIHNSDKMRDISFMLFKGFTSSLGNA